MLFLEWRFDHFATQYRRFCRFTDSLTEQLSWVRLDIMTREATQYGIQRFKAIENTLLPCMLAFEQHTRSWGGWFFSFIPGTKAFRARSRLADCLNESLRLMTMLSFVNVRITQALNKAAHHAKCTLNASHKSHTQTKKPIHNLTSNYPARISSSWLSLFGSKQGDILKKQHAQPKTNRYPINHPLN